MTGQSDDISDLKILEKRIDELISKVGTLTVENTELRNKQGSLVKERAKLIEKTELARGRIESMISRLKSMESN